MTPATRLLSALVVGYQRGVGPLLGPHCRFEPTCSSYGLEALRVHGALRGSALMGWRLLRCQPLGTPGYDPVPPATGVGRMPVLAAGSTVARGRRAC